MSGFIKERPRCGDSLFPAPQLPGLSLALGEFRSNSGKPQLEVPWRVGCPGDTHRGPSSEKRLSWRAALRVPLHPRLNCPTGGILVAEQGASRATGGRGTASDPGYSSAAHLGDRSVILVRCQRGLGPMCSLGAHQENPRTRLITVIIMVLKLAEGLQALWS